MQFLNLTFNRLITILIISLLSACNNKTVTTPSERGAKPVLVHNNFIQTPYEGSCEGYKFPLRSNDKSTWPLRVLRNNAPVYYEAHGYNKKTTLKFGEVLNALSISDSKTSGRVQICESGCKPGEALGWMDRQDLLCGIKPLKNHKGLERKAFIRL